jgi:hypothetical protein
MSNAKAKNVKIMPNVLMENHLLFDILKFVLDLTFKN